MKRVKILSGALLIANCLCSYVNAASVDKGIEGAAYALMQDIIEARLSDGLFGNIWCRSWQNEDAALLSKRIACGANMDYEEVSSSDVDLVQLFGQAEKSKRGMVIFFKNAHEYLRPSDYIQDPKNIQCINAFLLLTFSPSKKVIFIVHTDDKSSLDGNVINRMSKII